MSPEDEFSIDSVRREGLLEPSGAAATTHDGTGRVELAFSVADTSGTTTSRSVRVPPG